MQTRQLRSTEAVMTPEQTIITANQLAYRSSPDAPLRALAAEIVGNTPNVRRDAPPRIAAWVRDNVRYFQESPGIETLQGPYTTLPHGLQVGSFAFTGTGVGDCDDLAILFATLCRAVGLNAYVCGIAPYPYDGIGFVHAVGYCADDRRFYELSKDEAYGGIPNKPLQFAAPPLGMCGLYYCPVEQVFRCLLNDPEAPAPSYDASMGYYTPDGAPAVPAMPRSHDAPRTSAGTLAHGRQPRRLNYMGTTARQTDRVVNSFVGAQPTNPSGQRMSPNSKQFREVTGEALEQVNNLIRDMGGNTTTLIGADPTSNSTLNMVIDGTGLVLQEAGVGPDAMNVYNSSAGALVNLAQNPTPAGAVNAGVTMGVSIARAAIRTRGANRRQEEYGDKIDALIHEMITLSLGIRKSAQGVPKDKAFQALLMAYRMYECNAIMSDTYGRKASGFRGRVKIGRYKNVFDLTGRERETADGLEFLRVYGGYGDYASRLEADRKGISFFDGTTAAQGMNWVGNKQLSRPLLWLSDQHDATRLTRDWMRAIGQSSGFTGEGLQELHLAVFWSAIAQAIILNMDSTVQGGDAEAGYKNGVKQTQRSVPISQDTFWQPFEATFNQTPEDCVTPCALFFGATAQELVAGEFGKYLTSAGFQNYKIFQQSAGEPIAEEGWGFTQPATPATPASPAAEGRGVGGLIALGAAAAGALLLSGG